MEILTIVISIMVFSSGVWILNKIAGTRICPPCAGVFLTWAGLLMLYWGGYRINLLAIGILMGGSVTGISYWLETYLAPGKSPLLWKIIFLPAGFALVYGIIFEEIVTSVLSLVAVIFIAVYFLGNSSSRIKSEQEERAIEGLEKKMKNCC